MELPGSGDRDPSVLLEDRDRHDAGVLTTLSQHTAVQPEWLGYLDTGATDVIFDDVPKMTLYSGWEYVLIEAGPGSGVDGRAAWRSALADSSATPIQTR